MKKYSSVNRLAKAPEGVLKECGLMDGDLQAVLEWQRGFQQGFQQHQQQQGFQQEFHQPFQAKVESHGHMKTRPDRFVLVSQYSSELQILDDKAKESWQIFLYYVYAKHPPPGPDKKLFAGELNAQTKKSALLLAIKHFHSNKMVDSENHTLKFLHEEITKRLNRLNRD